MKSATKTSKPSYIPTREELTKAAADLIPKLRERAEEAEGADSFLQRCLPPPSRRRLSTLFAANGNAQAAAARRARRPQFLSSSP